MSYAANIIINPPTHTNGSEGKLRTAVAVELIVGFEPTTMGCR